MENDQKLREYVSFLEESYSVCEGTSQADGIHQARLKLYGLFPNLKPEWFPRAQEGIVAPAPYVFPNEREESPLETGDRIVKQLTKTVQEAGRQRKSERNL